MSEAQFQSKIIKQYKKDGWKPIRLIQTTDNGIADTLMLKRCDDKFLTEAGYVRAVFIEFKAKGEKPDPLQVYRHKEMFEKTGVKTIVMTEP